MKKTTILIVAAIIVFGVGAFLILRQIFNKSEAAPYIAAWKNTGAKGNLTILEPRSGAVFPPEIIAPTFTWNDRSNKVNTWLAIVEIDGKVEHVSEFLKSPKWKPDSEVWEYIKRLSIEKDAVITVLGINRISPKNTEENANPIYSSGHVTIKISKDSVGAPIFYRAVTLPFGFAIDNLETISWRLGDISKEDSSRIVLENLPVCGNCHSFSKNGRVMGMDVDYGSDKGSYFISPIEKNMKLEWANIITWSDYKREDGDNTFGLLSQISPDGRYALSTVKDRSIFVRKDNLWYSQLFFPIKGIIAVYDREKKKFWALPGADNPEFCQSNPSWSPDGKTILFARAPYFKLPEAEMSKEVVLPTYMAKEFIDGKRDYKYDIYKIPFNEGKGGIAEPLTGASNNGMSNFFPRYSPDGKWLVFTQAKNFMLLQPDATLYIMPSTGGKPRKMNCNNDSMNSWHSWSPNGKWLVFSSKRHGPYTQMYLTHIDKNGNDSPPVLLENFSVPERAVNIPEFVNINSKSLDKIVENFIDSDNYAMLKGKNKLKLGDLNGAFKDLTRAIELDSSDDVSWNFRGIVKIELGDIQGAIKDFSKVIQLKPKFFDAYANRASAKFNLNDFEGALADYNKVIELNPKGSRGYFSRGVTRFNLGNYEGAIADYNKTLRYNPKHDKANYNRALCKFHKGDYIGAISDYNKAIEINPKDDRAYFERGLAKSQTEGKEGACDDLRKAYDMGNLDAKQYIDKYCNPK